MKIYFIRHGQSEYNVRKLMNSDKKVKVRLTLKGQTQAMAAGQKLKSKKIEAIFSSEFLRARETAEIINKKLKVKIHYSKKLNEIKQGFEGETSDEFWKAAEKSGDFLNFKLKGKESFIDVKKRVLAFLNSLKNKKLKNVLVVSHESILMAARAISGKLNDKNSFLKPIGNCEIVEIRI